MKYLVFIFLFFALLSCHREKNPAIDELEKENDSLTKMSIEKEKTIDAFIKSMNEISDNLSAIKEKENIITLNTSGKNLEQSVKDKISDDIQSIYDLMVKNKKMIYE